MRSPFAAPAGVARPAGSRSFWRRLLRWAAAGLFLLAGLLAAAIGAGWWALHASLPPLSGAQKLAGLSGPVTIERDANGIPTIRAQSREDASCTLGYLHGQERFFGMDLLRRQGAGELAELFGPAALTLDIKFRRFQFRRRAPEMISHFSADSLRMLDAYVAGVNAGLASLRVRPWEYLLLRQIPRPWTREDSVLVLDTMAANLQSSGIPGERTRLAIADAYTPEVLSFLWPRVMERTAALDGSSVPAPPVPPAEAFAAHPAGRQPGTEAFAPGDPPATAAALAAAASWRLPGSLVAEFGEDAFPGSNEFALAGSRVAGGGALVANDMHLGLGLPHIWYRVAMQTPGRTFTGVTLPGVPGAIVGSNGYIAWGFTDAYIGASDAVIVEVDPANPTRYRVPDGDGWEKFRVGREAIQIGGGLPAYTQEITSTRWGPLLTPPGGRGRTLALHWIGLEPTAVNFGLDDLLDAHSIEAALAAIRKVDLPAENFVVGDRAGRIAWTLIGPVPRRVGFDGYLPESWADGSKHWDGVLSAEENPAIVNPPAGQLWSANNRAVGGDALARIGDGGYDDPARAAQIRDRLTALSGRAAVPADLLAVQLDDESRFLARWRQLLTAVLSDEALARDPRLRQLRALVLAWHGHAAVDEPGHRLVKTFRSIVSKMVLDPIYEPVRQRYPNADFGPGYEQPLWSILQARPAWLLPAGDKSWDDLLVRAAVSTVKLAEQQPDGTGLAGFTWGKVNTLAMRHPLSGALPAFIARRLDMTAQALPGDTRMPRVQGTAFGASERMVVSPGRESEGIFHQPGGASGNPLSPFYRAGHEDWVQGKATPFLPGKTVYTLTLQP